MFARCCRRQLWRVPRHIPSRGLYLVRNISGETSSPPVVQDPPGDAPIQKKVSAVSLADKLIREKRRRSEFRSKTAHFLDLQKVMDDSEDSPFLFQYLPQERRLVYKPGKASEQENSQKKKGPRIEFRTVYNAEPTRQWKIKVYDAALNSIRKSIMSTRQVRGHLHGAQNRIFNLNKLCIENLGPLAAGPAPQGDDEYPNVDLKDLRMMAERDGYGTPLLLWVSIAHLESEQLAMGQWASKILDPPRIWQRTLSGVADGEEVTPDTDDFTWILDRFSDTIMETERRGPGRDIFGEGKRPPVPVLPVIFSLREHFFWFIWRDPPYGPMEGQYSGNWIPRLPGVLTYHEKLALLPKTPPAPESKRPWTRKVQKRPTGRAKRPKAGEGEGEAEDESYNKEDWW